MGSRARNGRIFRVTTVTGFALACLAAVSPAAAQTTPPPAARAGARPVARLLKTPYRPIVLELRGLDLTREQRQQILGIFKMHRPEMQALAAKVRAARQGWRQSGKIDIQERKALDDQHQTLLRGVNTEVLALLTPEQQKQAEARRLRAFNRRRF